jgi:3D (Asp-Asp-Asp) domain-containing protein
MIKITLTTTTGTTKGMQFDTKENVMTFIEQYANVLPIGTAVCIDAPIIGIHNGWIQGKKVLQEI